MELQAGQSEALSNHAFENTFETSVSECSLIFSQAQYKLHLLPHPHILLVMGSLAMDLSGTEIHNFTTTCLTNLTGTKANSTDLDQTAPLGAV